jgi:flagellar hook assembly protein FlgD
LPQQSQVTLEIYNVLGQRVRTLVADDLYEAGYYDVVWDGRNQAGGVVSSGLYIYRITAGEFTNVKKMLFLK